MAQIALQDFREHVFGNEAVGVIDPTTQAPSAGGDQFTNADRTFLWVKNTSGGPITITIPAEAADDHGATHNLTVTVPDGTNGRLVGPFQFQRFSAVSRLVSMTYSGTPAGFEVAAIRL